MSILVVISIKLQLLHQPHPLILTKFEGLPSEHPSLLNLLHFPNYRFPTVRINVHEYQGILDEVALHQFIEGTLATETGGVVDLQQPSFTLRINHDVKPKYLEAHIILKVMGLAHPIFVSEVGLPTYQRFYDDILYICPYLSRVYTGFLESLEELS